MVTVMPNAFLRLNDRIMVSSITLAMEFKKKKNEALPFQKLEMTETGEEEEVLGLSLSDPPSGASIF